MKQSVFFFITLLIIKTLRIESSHRYRISFVVVKLLKDSVLKLAAYQPPFQAPPKSDNHFGMECNRIIPTSHRHPNRLASALLTVCLLRLPPLGSCSVIQGERRRGLCFFTLSAAYLQNNRLFKGNPLQLVPAITREYRSLLLRRNSINHVSVTSGTCYGCKDTTILQHKKFLLLIVVLKFKFL